MRRSRDTRRKTNKIYLLEHVKDSHNLSKLTLQKTENLRRVFDEEFSF